MRETYTGLVVFQDFAEGKERPFLFQGLGQPFPELAERNGTFRKLDMKVVEVTGSMNGRKDVLNVDSVRTVE